MFQAQFVNCTWWVGSPSPSRPELTFCTTGVISISH